VCVCVCMKLSTAILHYSGRLRHITTPLLFLYGIIMSRLTHATLCGSFVLTQMTGMATTPRPTTLSPTSPNQTPVDKPNSSVLLLSPPLLIEDSSRTILPPTSTALVTTSTTTSADGDRWVVAYGYTSLNEFHELLDLLTSFGSLQQHHQSGGNWLAVQYESRLAVERALCSQPVTLRNNNTLCGTVRGTPALLQSLWTRTTKSVETTTSTTTAFTKSSNPRPFIQSGGGGSTRSDDDVDSKWLLNTNDDNDDHQHRSSANTSVCQKVMSWYFGWEYIATNKNFSNNNDDDDDRHHPHSD
jgi:hypothetical protein